MADKFLFANNAKSTLASGISAVATSIFLSTGEGALFPSPGAGERFTVTLVDSAGNVEIAYCTTRVSDTLTVIRGQESTTAIAFLAADVCELRFTDGALGNIPQNDGTLQVDLNSDLWDGANKTVSLSAPTGGLDGDIWLQYE